MENVTFRNCSSCGKRVLVDDTLGGICHSCGTHNVKLNHKEVKIAYRKYFELVDRYGDNPSRGQKAALTRRWRFFVKQCVKNDVDPDRYSYSEAQP